MIKIRELFDYPTSDICRKYQTCLTFIREDYLMVTRLFVQLLVQFSNKGNFKALYHWCFFEGNPLVTGGFLHKWPVMWKTYNSMSWHHHIYLILWLKVWLKWIWNIFMFLVFSGLILADFLSTDNRHPVLLYNQCHVWLCKWARASANTKINVCWVLLSIRMCQALEDVDGLVQNCDNSIA